jgi:hypothetical protein
MAEKKLVAKKNENVTHEQAQVDLRVLAERLSSGARGSLRSSDWDDGEAQVFSAMVHAALRQKSMGGLESALNIFGGLPPQGFKWTVGKYLNDAAMAPDAFGFERLLGAQQEQAMVGVKESGDESADESGEGARLGEWLRAGLYNSYYGSGHSGFDPREAASVGCSPKPVAACFAQDNPVALSKILIDPARRSALACAEPTPMDAPPDWRKTSSYSERDEIVNKGRQMDAGFEKSLLWQAVSMKAFRCAALLCALPEFSKPLLKDVGFGALSDRRHWFERDANQIFEESGEVPFSFFEWSAGLGSTIKSDSPYGARDEAVKSWRLMLESMIDAAGPEQKQASQRGTGMGWPEMFFVRTAPHRWGASAERGNEFAQADVALAMGMLSHFEAKGFAPQWQAMAEACGECRLLKDWMELKAASAASAGHGAPRKTKRSAL